MFHRFERIVIALMFALLFAGVTLIAVSAQDVSLQPAQETKDCATCHTDFQMTWQSGAHGQAMKDPVFTEEWTKQGKPSACLTCHVTGYDNTTATWKADGVTCEACHQDTGGEHPKTTMSVNTTNQCGTCHTDTRFGWNEWKGSTHYQNGMECTNCHDPHSTKVKVTGRNTKDASSLCMNCHKDVAGSTHGVHAQNGVTCADCHVTQMPTGLPAHTVPNHSFEATLTQCESCHKDQMHTSGEALGGVPANQIPEIKEASLVPEPSPVSPIGYAGLAALIGLAAGMLLSPWLERGYHLIVEKSKEVKNDEK